MNTEAAKQIAKERTAFMKTYLKEFFAEYEGADIISCVGSSGSSGVEE